MNVPKLRFKEFNDEWNYKTFDELINIKSESYNPSLNKENYKCIELEHINQNTGTINGYCNSQDQKSNKNMFKKNEVLFGKLRPYLKKYWYATFDGVCSSEIWVVKSKNQNIVTNKFIYDLFQSHYFLQLCNLSTGSKMPRADWSFIKEQVIAIPTIIEQEKIGKTLSLLDKKVELQAKKIEDLKLFKSSQIINFFNKNNFAEVNIKNIGFFQSGNSLSKDCLTSSGVPIILYGDLYTKYNEVIKKVEQYTNDNKKYVKSKQNQIIFPTSTTVNSLSLISPSSINLDGIIYGGDILILNLNKDVNADFLSYEINHYKKKEFSKIAQGSTIIHIHAEDLLNCKIALPNIVLQDKFALTFNKFNQKIELENNKLNKLQKLKKGLMQSMLV